ncbi:terminase large subunit domain-containing protein [Alphaproteobacteria bacterium endosymbiont of Tiliacea citrago]|uniref:terminase large subunit domain-containing protein n=1 Tax=Alphaproteobacteria bacterium endosymbiont of Tiliacea citrago TaxID=3077944 RepID=UPI00313D4B8E
MLSFVKKFYEVNIKCNKNYQEPSFSDFAIKKISSELNQQLLNALKKEYSSRFSIYNNQLEDSWDQTAREKQKLPEGDWFAWLILAGRGFGKTRAGAEAIKKLVLSQKYKKIALIGETFDQIRNVMIEGESGLLNLNYGNLHPTYLKSQKQIIWPNGAIATFYSAENPEQLRGPQFDLAWIDELAKFNNDKQVWDQLMFCLRLGKKPKVIITTTPRPKNLIFELQKRTDVYLTQGNTFENKQNLSESFLKIIEKEYGNTKFGKQEIFGELLDKDDNQLWTNNNFIYEKIDQQLILQMNVIIAIDPAMTAKETSDETGIIVAGKLKDKFYILEDASGKMNCSLWMEKACLLYEKYNAKKIIVENNQGGDVLMSMLKTFKNLPWESVRAKQDKYSRAIPIASLYEQKKVIHKEVFHKLEEQLLKAHLTFPDDRLDALTWALFELNNFKDTENFNLL